MSGALLPYSVALPLLAVPLILLLGHRPNAREAVSVLTGLLLFGLVSITSVAATMVISGLICTVCREKSSHSNRSARISDGRQPTRNQMS